jgi:hypothetical protein
MMNQVRTDDPERRLGRVLVMLCEWGRQARERGKTQVTENDKPRDDGDGTDQPKSES